jgi:hypothetical protein
MANEIVKQRDVQVIVEGEVMFGTVINQKMLNDKEILISS